MSALQKLKAYFGMVPAEDEDYEGDDDRYGSYRSDGYRSEYVEDDYAAYPERGPRRRRSGFREEADEQDYQPADRGRGRPAWAGDTPPTRGALAVEPHREPAGRLRPVPESAPAATPLGRIITLHPTSYIEARTIGEHYREGTPVIMNLTEMEDADARRLVDFAAGLAFALRGAMDKVTNKVFLISPPNVDVSAEDRRRLAEGGFASRG
ncbi:cell division protein SepF [Kibdelosporangium persicum]|uniref:Cell division protein SepF n=1 Tax=Kibdelosporangium persicum TaxID=2698649 RepID=A0ABX2EXG1_9PSEU|nr:cell division protein SepF [Kibdelosporangium persicum]NRN63554.1 Cell division inhibitor SepF [Kibdelosporangium persicum]